MHIECALNLVLVSSVKGRLYIKGAVTINSTYGAADALVLIQMSTEPAQTTCMNCYQFQTPADTMYL